MAFREALKCKVFLGFTSNLISSGVRDIIRFLLQHGMVDVVVTTAGGLEEDLVKCLSPTYKGDFDLPGAVLRSKGLNRIGNLLVPNDNYCKFEDWIIPIFDQRLREQNLQNNIPVFCAGLTDGSLGDMLYFHSFKSDPGLVIDIVQDIRAMNDEAVHGGLRKTGILILGGELPKHHICNVNMMRNGADFAVFVNIAQEYDGSDSGARPDEAVSWGKIRGSAKTVKVHCAATIAFPLHVAETFAEKLKRSRDKFVDYLLFCTGFVYYFSVLIWPNRRITYLSDQMYCQNRQILVQRNFQVCVGYMSMQGNFQVCVRVSGY